MNDNLKYSNVYQSVKRFMEAAGQTTDCYNYSQIKLYWNLIIEEFFELVEQFYIDSFVKRIVAKLFKWWLKGLNPTNGSVVEKLDAILDIIVVAIGYGYSNGWDLEGGNEEVQRTNHLKIDTTTGKCKKDPVTGKILKPNDWQPPNLKTFV